MFALVLGLAAVPLTQNLTAPYEGHFEENSAWMSSAARNSLAHGYIATHFAIADNDGAVPTRSLRYYMSHPPLVPLLVSISFQVFGPHEWAARLVPIGFTLASVVVIQRLGAMLGGAVLGWIAAFVYALSPMNAYFGRVTNYEPVTLFFVLLASLTYLRWHRERRNGWLALTTGSFVAAAIADWPGYYLGLLLPMHHFLSARRQSDARILLLPVAGVLLFAAHIGHVAFVNGPDGLQDLVNKFIYRAQLGAPGADGNSTFGIREFVLLEARRANALFTLPILVLAGAGLVDGGRRLRRARADGVDPSESLFPICLLGFAALHVLLFRNGAWVHDYWLHYFAVPLALLSASGALSLTASTTRVRILVAFGTLFVLAAVPQTRKLHRNRRPVMEVVDRVRATSAPEQIVLGNGWTTAGPRLAWHAGRYVHYGPVLTLPELASVAGGLDPKPIAYYRVMDQPLDPALERWLDAHGALTGVVSLAGIVHRVYHAVPIAETLSRSY